MHVQEMLGTSPTRPLVADVQLVACIEACFDCAQSCVACADACLSEPKIDMLRRCIRLNQDCADICMTTGKILSRQREPDVRLLHALLEACRAACEACGDECGKHGSMHEHCRVCATACRQCAKACQEALSALRGEDNARRQ